MGRPKAHLPRCIRCGRVMRHSLMKCVRTKSGRKIHFCPACQ